jgi:uncharacterized protein (TIGR00369 family)
MDRVSKMSTGELKTFFAEQFPQAPVTIEGSGPGFCRVRQVISDEHLRPGNTVAGPVIMWIADCATYGAILTEIGYVPLAVTTSATINFLRKPPPGVAIIGEARLLKLGKRLAVAEAKIISEKDEALLAHVTLTYSIPPT